MNPLDLKILIEATLLAAQRPVTEVQLLELFDERERPSQEQLQEALALLTADYEQRGIELLHVASGWRIQIKAKCMDVVSRLWQERPSRYSRALLETLALIAYRQPITRSEIEDIRGVAVSSTIMRTLQERNWIRVVGHREVPGRPEVLGTTKDFLDYFGLQNLDQLPSLAELQDVENVGVQLELPNHEAPITSNEVGSETLIAGVAMSEETSTASDDANDADADIEVIDSNIEMNAADVDMDVEESDGEASSDADQSDDQSMTSDDQSDDQGDDDIEPQSASSLVADSDHAVQPLHAPAAE